MINIMSNELIYESFPDIVRVIQHTEEIIRSAQQTNAMFELTCSILYGSTI